LQPAVHRWLSDHAELDTCSVMEVARFVKGFVKNSLLECRFKSVFTTMTCPGRVEGRYMLSCDVEGSASPALQPQRDNKTVRATVHESSNALNDQDLCLLDICYTDPSRGLVHS
jgi:hypothetical protein